MSSPAGEAAPLGDARRKDSNPRPFVRIGSIRLPAGGASFTVNGAMLSMAYTSRSPIQFAGNGELWTPCVRVKLAHRAPDAADSV